MSSNKVIKNKSLDYESLLWNLSTIAQEATVDRKWSEVAAVLKEQGIDLAEAPTGDEYEWILANDLPVGTKGLKQRLYILFQVDIRDPTRVPNANPGIVIAALAGLRIDLRQEFKTLLQRLPYPEASVMPRMLVNERLLPMSKEFPIVDQLDLQCGIIYDLNSDDSPVMGFLADLSLRQAKGDDWGIMSFIVRLKRPEDGGLQQGRLLTGHFPDENIIAVESGGQMIGGPSPAGDEK